MAKRGLVFLKAPVKAN